MAETRLAIVHTLAQARFALETANSLHRPIILQSPPDAIFYAGSLYFLHLFEQAQKSCPKAEAQFILDCADAGAEAVEAMRIGHRHIRSNAPPTLCAKLKAIAAGLGVTFEEGTYEALDLLTLGDTKGAYPQRILTHWLQGEAA